YMIRNAMLSRQPENEDQLIKLGQRMEKDIALKQKSNRGRQFDSRAFQNEFPPLEGYDCENCENPMEMMIDYGEEENGNYADLNVMNSNGNQYGNNRFENKPSWQPYNNTKRTNDRQQRLCYKCHQTENMCYLPVLINKESVQALVDSGSNGTIIDHQLLILSGYKEDDIKPWRFGKVNLALGNEAVPYGTVMLKINVFDKELIVETIV